MAASAVEGRAAEGCFRMAERYRENWEESFDRLEDYYAKYKKIDTPSLEV